MPENSPTPLPRRRFGQGILAAVAALFALKWHRFKGHRFKGHRFETCAPKNSLREADFYEIERPLP
jgi:hypothetical protein